MFLLLFFVLTLVDAKPSIDPLPPLAMLNIVPDDFLKFFFTLKASEKQLIEELFLKQTGKLSIDEKTKVFIDKIRESDPKLGERLHDVIKVLVDKKKLLTGPAQELFDLLLVKPNVNESTRDELKKLTQLRLQKWDELTKRDKWSLKKQFPEIYSFFATLLVDKETLEFADRVVV